MIFTKFIELYNHQHNPIFIQFPSPQISLIPICSHSPLLPPDPDKHQSAFCIYRLAISGLFSQMESYNMQSFASVFFSFSLRFLKFTHVVTCVSCLFLSIVKQYSMVWIYHNLFIYSPADGHLDCYCFFCACVIFFRLF